jgi:hypothetical protein
MGEGDYIRAPGSTVPLQNPATGCIFKLLVRVVSDVKPRGAGNGQHEAPDRAFFHSVITPIWLFPLSTLTE